MRSVFSPLMSYLLYHFSSQSIVYNAILMETPSHKARAEHLDYLALATEWTCLLFPILRVSRRLYRWDQIKFKFSPANRNTYYAILLWPAMLTIFICILCSYFRFVLLNYSAEKRSNKISFWIAIELATLAVGSYRSLDRAYIYSICMYV